MIQFLLEQVHLVLFFKKVIRARNKLENKVYALKMIFLTEMTSNSDFLKTFPEIKSLSRLEHKNIVKYYTSWVEHFENYQNFLPEKCILEMNKSSIGLTGSEKSSKPAFKYTFFIQMEFCAGNTLGNWLEKRTLKWTPGQIFHIFQEILKGIAHVHSMGIVHRDLKLNKKAN